MRTRESCCSGLLNAVVLTLRPLVPRECRTGSQPVHVSEPSDAWLSENLEVAHGGEDAGILP